MDSPIERPKVVRVREYIRMRLRRLERVRAHWRSTPHQFTFGFYQAKT